jgi:NADPH:quinone reductase
LLALARANASAIGTLSFAGSTALLSRSNSGTPETAVEGKHEDVAEAALQLAPDGVDAILALAGGDALERAVEVLRRGGRLAYPNGIEPEPTKRRGIEFIPYDAVSGVREFERLNRAVEAAKLKVPIAEAFALARANKAHERLAEGHVLGKMVLRTQLS